MNKIIGPFRHYWIQCGNGDESVKEDFGYLPIESDSRINNKINRILFYYRNFIVSLRCSVRCSCKFTDEKF